jgi:hypothetical protein
VAVEFSETRIGSVVCVYKSTVLVSKFDRFDQQIPGIIPFHAKIQLLDQWQGQLKMYIYLEYPGRN